MPPGLKMLQIRHAHLLCNQLTSCFSSIYHLNSSKKYVFYNLHLNLNYYRKFSMNKKGENTLRCKILGPVWTTKNHHSISVTQFPSLITHHSSLITQFFTSVCLHHSVSITHYFSHYLEGPRLS